MAPDRVKTYKALLPLSWIYGAVVRVRNRLFDNGLLPSEEFAIPVITVGNIAVGGTGKTPHVEYIARLLRHTLPTAVLSRGYRRKTKGFVLADEHSTADDIGDEPFQIKQKFDDVTVAVDADRRHGLHTLLEMEHAPGVVILDDAFQHRYVKAGLSILLTDYHRLLSRDYIMPAGRLREPRNGMARADIVVVTKCPPQLTVDDASTITSELKPRNGQAVYFSTIDYAPLQPLKGSSAEVGIDDTTHVLLLTGIASPGPMIEAIRAFTPHVEHLSYPDHHDFTTDDIRHISQAFDRLPEPKMLVTTEKDAARLESGVSLPADVLKHCYTMPISIRVLHGKEEEFNNKITNYVLKNSRNSSMD